MRLHLQSVCLGSVGQDDGKFVTTPSGDNIRFATGSPQDIGHGHKQVVTGRMAKGVVVILGR